MAAPAAAGFATHVRRGNVDWRLALGLAAGACAGSWASASTAVQAPPFVMEVVFAAGMAVLGVRTLRGLRAATAAAAQAGRK